MENNYRLAYMVFKNSLTFPEAAVSAKMCSVTQG